MKNFNTTKADQKIAAIKFKEYKQKGLDVVRSKGLNYALGMLSDLKDKYNAEQTYVNKKIYDGFKKGIYSSEGYASFKDINKEIDVLMLAQDDWSNTGYRFSLCLKALGLNVVIIKGKAHSYNYPIQAPIDPALSGKLETIYPRVFKPKNAKYKEYLRGLIRSAKVVHFFASTYIDLGIEKELKRKHVVVQHGGTTYRQAPKLTNNIFNKFADATVIQCPDLLYLGAKNEHLIYYPVQTDIIKPNFEKMGSKLLVGHFPSSPKNKGTKEILEIIQELEKDPIYRDKFEYIGTRSLKQGRRSWEEQLKVVSKCDVLIETMCLNQGEKIFGEWGNTAIEAAALGKVVLTNSRTKHIYSKEYGQTALNIVNNKKQLKEQLIRFIEMTDKDLKKQKILTRKWVVQNHSIEANAIRLWNKIYKNFFPDLKINLNIGE